MNARPPCQFLLFVVVIVASNSPGNRAGRCADGRTALSIAIARVVANGCTGHSANTGTYNGVEIISMGLRGQHCQATRDQGEACQLADFCSRWREKRRRK